MKRFLKITLLAAGVATGFVFSAQVGAVDTPVASGAPDLAKARALIKAQDYKSAIVELNARIDAGAQHADVYNLLGFSLRKTGDLKNAATYYRKALDYDPKHLGALEYQGEMFVIMRDFAAARRNLDKLATLCPTGCDEREDLAKAIGAATASN